MLNMLYNALLVSHSYSWPLCSCKQDKSHPRPKVHNILQCCHKKEDQAMVISNTQKNLVNLGRVVSVNIHTHVDRQACHIYHSMLNVILLI